MLSVSLVSGVALGGHAVHPSLARGMGSVPTGPVMLVLGVV